jgi:hypothetical protein
MTSTGLPSSCMTPPLIPCGRAKNGLRSPVAVSYCWIVTRTGEFAGTVRWVLWTHSPSWLRTR